MPTNKRVRDKASDETKKIFADNLSDYLDESSKKFKMTGKELAKKIGVSEGIISQYRQAKNAPSLDKLKRIAEALGVSCDYLLGRTTAAAPDDFIQAVNKHLGLSEAAIIHLVEMHKTWAFTEVSEFIEDPRFSELMRCMHRIKDKYPISSELRVIKLVMGEIGLWEHYRQRMQQVLDSMINAAVPKPSNYDTYTEQEREMLSYIEKFRWEREKDK